MTRHEIDYFSLAAGALFTFLGLVFTVTLLGDWDLDTRWAFPLTLIVLGAGGVAASLNAGRRERRAFDEHQAALASSTSDDSGTGLGTDSR